MKLKPVLLQSALVFTCCTAAGLLLCNQLSQAQGQQPAANQVPQVEQQLPAALEQILKNWENESAKIQKLEGNHLRREYDDVFQVEKKSEGKFYYEQPDKGRIDISGMKIPEGAKSDKPNDKGGFYALKPGQDERWICDGKRIFSIDENEKKYEVYPIPLERRGVNIMEGPLPFLFGMPAKVAKERYFLKLLVNTPEQIIIAAKPRRKADAANYREAKIKLDPKTYLPAAVQLIHPSGKQSTVYIFSDVVANKNRIIDRIWGTDPFTPKLAGYRLEGKVAAVPEEKKVERPVQQPIQRPVQQVPVQQATFKVPNMVGHDFQSAEALLQKMGFQTKVWPGDPADEPRLIHHVYQQVPVPGATAKKGQTVHLKLYIDPNKAKD
ncbi:PASTA domain-containing protein [Gimesia algae]|uniref:PASTA domain protein n=1 Tax=Gimesia algae TaxID=2527971 RepID=A0A517VKI8_9PLAN|nr:PASTA domain-containing protein [Gimesia algae]QDT93533.1 PASTA domain protein [Gimesia algae]